MVSFKILGSCSGTEPMAGRHHTSIVLEAGKRNYFFDAGENCAHTAHTQGVDLMKTRAVFISHTHFDHVGGLMGLFWTIKKLCSRYDLVLADGKVRLFLPQVQVWDALSKAMESIAGRFGKHFDIEAEAVKLGAFYEDEFLRVEAFESHHSPLLEDGSIQSFSYRITVGEKTAVFSGDIRDMDDLLDAVGDGCDLLLCETGHHQVKTVCDFAESHNVKRLVFVHHGREILEDRPSVKEALAGRKIPIRITNDGEKVEL